jgi:uncharacterized protein (TIGR00369 family)
MITQAEATAILEENFAEWVRDLGLEVEATGDDHVRLRVAFSPKLCRVGGIVCGQALISAADTAMVLALASALGGLKPLTTVDLTINYMRPIKDEDTRVTATIKRLGKTLAFCTADIAGKQSEKLAAFATGTYAILAS